MKINTKLIAIFLFAMNINFSNAQSINDFFIKSDKFFQTFVINDNVDYELLSSNPQQLKNVLKLLQPLI